MLLRRLTIPVVVVMLVTGCAALRQETPASIVVADKEQRTRWETTVIGQRRSPVTGRVQDIRREDLLDEYWVKDTTGHWYRVPKDDWQRAVVGQPLELHPALPERRPRPSSVWPCIGPDGVWRCD